MVESDFPLLLLSSERVVPSVEEVGGDSLLGVPDGEESDSSKLR